MFNMLIAYQYYVHVLFSDQVTHTHTHTHIYINIYIYTNIYISLLFVS